MRKNSIVLAGVGVLWGLGASNAAMAGSLVRYTLEPIVGYERSQKLLPDPHTKNRLVYGARLRAGIPLISLEAQFTRGDDTESFPAQDLTLRDQDDKLKVGLVNSISMSRLVSMHLRAGGQASRNLHEETQAGVTNSTKGAIVYKPYAGLGLSGHLGHNFTLTGGITAVFKEFPNMSKNEYETTLGFDISFP